MKFTCILILSLTVSVTAYSQDENLNKAYKKEIINSINFQLKDKYVFPDVADLMAEDILKRYKRGDYDEIMDKTIFADSLKSHLFAISKDKHIGVSYDREKAARLRVPKMEENQAEKFKRVNERVRKFNYSTMDLRN